ncbi:hypothetical protein HA402_008967 [Bradysia odoriphaga]|nr:hypothetical protein HA402_008967 [Bradysia odoriphaga]
MSKINRLCCCIENENSLTFDERDPYVGIQETVGGHPKLNGFIKHRMSHFHVNEIGLDGKIVHLTDLSPPSKPADVTPDEPFYVHCTLYKEGVAHPEVVDRLVRKLRIINRLYSTQEFLFLFVDQGLLLEILFSEITDNCRKLPKILSVNCRVISTMFSNFIKECRS